VLRALDWIIQRHTVVSVSDPVFSSLYEIPTSPVSNGLSSMRILANGDITPSTYLISEEWIAGNIRQVRSLAELGQTAPFQRFVQPLLPRECEGCPRKDSCRAAAMTEDF
jgi:radical SAM protein with 4Fe4S-binding SPASM domain